MTIVHPIKTPLPAATATALEIWEKLKPYCYKGNCKIAGSIRRREKKVKDIELVCVPIVETVADGLFSTKQVRNRAFIEAVLSLGKVIKGNVETGKYIQIKLHSSNLVLDLFSVTRINFGLQLLIRTGPWYFSKEILYKFNVAGYHSDQAHPCNKYHCLLFFNEMQVFEFLKIPYLEPEERGK